MPWRYCRSIRLKPRETCRREVTTWLFYTSCVLRRTSRSERRRWPHSLWVVWCPFLWSRSAISGCVSLTWRSRRRYSSWMLPCRRSGSLPLGSVVESVAGRKPSPSRPPPSMAESASARGSETGDPEMEETARQEMVTPILPPPEEGRAENLLFRFCFPPLAQQPAVPKTSIKEQFPQSLCLKRRSVGPCITEALPSSSSLASEQQWVAQVHRSCLFQGRPFPCFKSSHSRLSQASSRVPASPPKQGGIRWVLHFTPRPCPLPSQALGRVPVFHHAAPPQVSRWFRWFCWHGLLEPG